MAIVLSGTGSDGSLGLKGIKEVGGLVMAQDPDSAGYDAMPRNAIATGLVDFVLQPDAMPQHLIDYCNRAFRLHETPTLMRQQTPMPNPIQQILFMIRAQTNHDFTHYKPVMIRRRIEHLMVINRCDTIETYARFLQNNPTGIDVLFHDLLIRVTNFFRDKKAFDALRDQVIPQLFENRPPEQPVRIWVPACSTGEEAYSIAILIREHLKTLPHDYKVQIFATDLDQEAIHAARNGVYDMNAAIGIPDEYLRQYFMQTPEGNYQVTGTLRSMMIFSVQNLTTDLPFSNLDLISCRNLLIYLDTDMQENILASFHFALAPLGFLFLGSAESLRRAEEDFEVISLEHRIFQRPQGPPNLRFQRDIRPAASVRPTERSPAPHLPQPDLRSIAENFLLNERTPTCFITDEQGYIRHMHTHSDLYLEVRPGEMNSPHLIGLVHEDLKIPLKEGLDKAVRQQQEIFRPAIAFTVNGEKHFVHLTVQPLPLTEGERLLMVILEELRPEIDDTEKDLVLLATNGEEYHLIAEELNNTRASLRETITKLEASNDQLQTANEELYSANEELRTSQQELNALNEELRLTNAELEGKVVEAIWANNDLTNTMNIMQTGLILLDSNLCIRRFNRRATHVFKLIPSDIGRLISHVISDFDYPQLPEDVEIVFQTLISIEKHVQTRDGSWYGVQIRPYRTMQNAIKGVMIFFNNITEHQG